MSKYKILQREGLQVPRILMVLSSFSPLFILWMIRGSCQISDPALFIVGGLLVLIPTGFLVWWVLRARKNRLKQVLYAGETVDHTNHVLVYLFANLFPFLQEDPGSIRELLSIVFALAFIAFVFYRLNLHYINILFAFRGYRIFTVSPPHDDNQLSESVSYVLITKRRFLTKGDHILSYRLSDTVYLETSE